MVEVRSEGGVDGASLIEPVGSFLLGFGRGFLVATSGSARASPLDVDAAASLVMMGVVARGLGCGGLVLFRGWKYSGRVADEIE